MQVVKCFVHDSWVDKNVLEMESGDIFAHQGETFVVKAKPYVLGEKPHIPAEPYDCGPPSLCFNQGLDYVHMAMDYTCSLAHDFGDGTMQICEFGGGNTNVYSPRLLSSELNQFCKDHIDRYKSFFNEHESLLESGKKIEIPKFW